MVGQMADRVARAEEQVREGERLLEKAIAAEGEKRGALERAEDDLTRAGEAVHSARWALSACEAGGGEQYEPPDCSWEERLLAEAEAVEAEARQSVGIAANELEEAICWRREMERKCELARESLRAASTLHDGVRLEIAARLTLVSVLVEKGGARLGRAESQLQSYLSSNHHAAQFSSWLSWGPQRSSAVRPSELHARLSLSKQQQRLFAAYLAERDPAFRARIASYRRELGEARSAAERNALRVKCTRGLSGLYAERLVEYAMRPLGGRINTQSSTSFENGNLTRTDLIVEGLKEPVIFGQGEGMGAVAGGSLAAEVKCGRAPYLFAQREHMVFQSRGHLEASASMTICSRDIKDLSPEQEKELRTALREAGSPLVGMLPRKDEIDEACWGLVEGYWKPLEEGADDL